jgi:hypothetical protein
VPTTAQDRVRRGPLAALLILLSLVLTSGTAAAGYDSGGAASRLGSSRQGTTTALLPPGTRNPLDDEAPGGGPGPLLLPSEPGIVTETLPATPRSAAGSNARPSIAQPATPSYRARAPPAS